VQYSSNNTIYTAAFLIAIIILQSKLKIVINYQADFLLTDIINFAKIYLSFSQR